MRVNSRLTAWLSGLLLVVVSFDLLATPQIQTWKTTQKIPVLFVAVPDLPILDVRIAFRAGSARDEGKAGLASLTADMLNQGAGEWNANAIAERLEAYGARLAIDVQRDMSSVSLRTLTRQPALGQALETLAMVIAQPRFEESDFKRMRANVLTSLSKDEQDPGTVGQKAIYRHIYGDHPYANEPSGTKESVENLSREDLQRFHARHYVASNAIIALVGAVSRSEAEVIAEQLTLGLAPGEPIPSLPPVEDLGTSTQEQIIFPSTQTYIYTGQPGMTRTDPDYFPLYVGNHILGGSGLVSLLMEEVREKRGLSYSVYSYFLPLTERGPFLAGLSTKNEQGALARQVMMTTIERFRIEGPTQEELTAAKKNITGGFPLRIAGNGKIAQYLAMIGFYGLPLDYLDRFNDRVAAVTTEDIRHAFQRRVDPAHFTTVIVGPESRKLNPATP